MRSTADLTIVDRRITLLIATGAVMAANCELCLNQVVPDLIEARVQEHDNRKAVEIGQIVKGRAAALMKQSADVLTGSELSRRSVDVECPAAGERRQGQGG